MKEKILLIGGGGHCRAVIDVIEEEGRFQVGGIVDTEEKVGKEVLGYKIIATDEELKVLRKDFKYALITVGQVGLCEKRKKLFELCKELGFIFPVIISPKAYVSRRAKIGEGTVIMHNAVVNANAKIGVNCIINTSSIIEHDAEIGDHTHVSTGAIINGGVKVGKCCFIGSNSVTKENTIIPDNTFIKAGSVVK